MKIDASLTQPHGHDTDRYDAPSMFELAGELERRGYDGVLMPEAAHDPFVALAIAAAATSRVQIGTSIAVALARNPMTLAYVANDLQLLSRGRFVLGLGSQVQQHIERRFSEDWTKPVARMKEMIVSLRAIWASWNDGSRLNVRGEFWSHTLMSPFFSPGTNPYGPPPIHLAGVSERMTELAGQLCEGFCAHSFTSPEYLHTVTWPALRRGRATTSDELPDPEVTLPLLLVTGATDEEFRDTRGRPSRRRSASTRRPPPIAPCSPCTDGKRYTTRRAASYARGGGVSFPT